MNGTAAVQPPLVVALGARRYRVERPFFAHAGPGSVSDVVVDSERRVQVLIRNDTQLLRGEPAVVTLDAAGATLGAFGGDVIADAHMLNAGADGRLFVVDRDAHQVVIFRGGVVAGRLGGRHRPLEPFNHPTGVALAPDGTVYVSDGYANHRIHRFAPDGTLLHAWGEFGDAPGAFMNPHAVWVQPDGRVVVVDRENDRLQVFSPEGVLLDIWRGFIKPLDVWGDADGHLFVADFVPSLTLLSPTGERLGRCRPVLNAAHGIAGDADGNLYLAEPSPSRVTRLVPLVEPD